MKKLFMILFLLGFINVFGMDGLKSDTIETTEEKLLEFWRFEGLGIHCTKEESDQKELILQRMELLGEYEEFGENEEKAIKKRNRTVLNGFFQNFVSGEVSSDLKDLLKQKKDLLKKENYLFFLQNGKILELNPLDRDWYQKEPLVIKKQNSLQKFKSQHQKSRLQQQNVRE